MFINPTVAIEQGWVTFPEWMTPDQRDKCIQPNALDFTIDRLFNLSEYTDVLITEDKSKNVMRTATEQHAVNKEWNLVRGRAYDGMSDFHVKVPDGIAAMLITRSTFNRCGTFIQSGLYDSGFNNYLGFVIYSIGGDMRIEPHTRIGQLIFVESNTSGLLYDGTYNNNKGQHWAATQ